MSKTIRLLSVLIILIFTSCATGNSLTNDTPSDFDSNYDDTTPPTTSSTFGNPALQINLEGSVYLTLNEDQDNMRQIIDAELKTVIDYEDPELAVKTLSVSATPEQDIPAVKNFYLGNHDDLVFVFFDAMEWNDESCLLIHAQNDIVTCLEDSSFELSSDIQFDGAGNVFYL